MWYAGRMRPPIFVRPLTDAEGQTLAAGLRSADAFVLRRCHILLASSPWRTSAAHRGAAGLRRPDRAGCAACLQRAWPRRAAERLLASPPSSATGILGPNKPSSCERSYTISPREFGHPTSLWTLDLAAEVSFAQGLTSTVITGEALRQTLLRLGIGWKRAKHWITSPDPAYVRKKGGATA